MERNNFFMSSFRETYGNIFFKKIKASRKYTLVWKNKLFELEFKIN